MAYDGKIAGHFPGRGNPNLDTLRIDYLAEGASTPSSISDMQKVKEVYASKAGETITAENLESHLVWRYFDELQNDGTTDQYLLFAFKPTIVNVTVNSISILVDLSATQQRGHLTIFSDDGLMLYSFGDNNSQENTEANTTMYGFTGIKRTTTLNNSITLYAGKTYWFHYHFGDSRNHRGSYFLPFNGHNCNGKYKNFGSLSPESIANSTSYPELANRNLTSEKTSSESLNENYRDFNVWILSGNATMNDRITNTNDQNFYYIRTDLGINYSFDKVLQGTGDGGGMDFGITHEQLATVEIGKMFIITGRYYPGRYLICRCISHDTSKTTEECYELLSDAYSELQNKTANYPVFTTVMKSSYIQNINNGKGASYWNTTYTDKRFYLEINGNERCAGDERK